MCEPAPWFLKLGQGLDESSGDLNHQTDLLSKYLKKKSGSIVQSMTLGCLGNSGNKVTVRTGCVVTRNMFKFCYFSWTTTTPFSCVFLLPTFTIVGMCLCSPHLPISPKWIWLSTFGLVLYTLAMYKWMKIILVYIFSCARGRALGLSIHSRFLSSKVSGGLAHMESWFQRLLHLTWFQSQCPGDLWLCSGPSPWDSVA